MGDEHSQKDSQYGGGRLIWAGPIFLTAVCCFAPAMIGHAQDLGTRANFTAQPILDPAQPANIWERGVGEGFRADAQSITLSAGASYALAILGSVQAHDLALVSLAYGHMLDHTLAVGHWYRGNFELRAELFTGAQFSPSSDWLVGLTPHLRYNFATGTLLSPFIDAGAGVTATGIGPPDLSGTFEFNLQGGAGIRWFFKDDLAVSVEGHYLHISCAGIHKPNLGLNGVMGTLGISFSF